MMPCDPLGVHVSPTNASLTIPYRGAVWTGDTQIVLLGTFASGSAMRSHKHGVGATATSETTSTGQRVHADWVRALVSTDLMDVRAQPVDARCWRVEATW
jgi:hypothetical protein